MFNYTPIMVLVVVSFRPSLGQSIRVTPEEPSSECKPDNG